MLKKARERLGLTQLEMANKLGISEGALSHYENLRRLPRLCDLWLIIETYQLSTDELLAYIKECYDYRK